MFYIKLSFRNIFRHKKRSLLTALTIMGCYVLCSMAIGLVYGTYGKVINTFTKGHSGHIQMHTPGFLERASLFQNIQNVEEIESTLKKNDQILSYSARVIGSVLVSAKDKTTGAKLIGINPEQEKKTTSIFENLREGHFFSSPSANDVVIGNNLSRNLGLNIGDEIFLMTQAADGSMANDKFKVIAILSESRDSFEAHNIYLPLQMAQDFLMLGNRVHEIALTISDYGQSQKIAKNLTKIFPKLEISPWQEIESEFYKAMKADQTGIWIDLGIMLFIVSIGVLNTVLMTILERTREFGILKAIGTKPTSIFLMVVTETTLMSCLSISLGILFSLLINYRLSNVGIPYPMPIEIGGMSLKFLYSEVSFFNIWVPAVVVSFSSIGVCLIPALRAAKIVPIEAIRST